LFFSLSIALKLGLFTKTLAKGARCSCATSGDAQREKRKLDPRAVS